MPRKPDREATHQGLPREVELHFPYYSGKPPEMDKEDSDDEPHYTPHPIYDEFYNAHLANIPDEHIHTWSKKNNYPFKPSEFFWDRVACPINYQKENVDILNAEMEMYKNAQIVEWNPDDPISYYTKLTDAQKEVLAPFSHEDNPELTAYDVTMAASCVQVYFNLIHKAGFGNVQFLCGLDGKEYLHKDNTSFQLRPLAQRTESAIRDIIYWLARIMAHRDYYWDSNSTSKGLEKKTYAEFDEEEKKRFDLMLDLFIDITPIIRINEYSVPPEFEFVQYEANRTKAPNRQEQKTYMQRVKFEAVRKHFRAFGNYNAISARYLGSVSYHAWGKNQPQTDYTWTCTEYPDPELVPSKNDKKQPEATATIELKEFKWDGCETKTTTKSAGNNATKTAQTGKGKKKAGKNATKKTQKGKDKKKPEVKGKDQETPNITVLPKRVFQERTTEINATQAFEAWSKTTIPLPIAIIFNQLQGWRNNTTTSQNSANRGKNKLTGEEQSSHNRVYDYRFITPEESKILLQHFPSCIDPSHIKMKVHEVPLTNQQKQDLELKEQPKNNTGSNTNNTNKSNNANKNNRITKKRQRKPGLFLKIKKGKYTSETEASGITFFPTAITGNASHYGKTTNGSDGPGHAGPSNPGIDEWTTI